MKTSHQLATLKLISAILLCFISITNAIASKWERISEEKNDIYYIDTESIVKIESKVYSYWILHELGDYNSKYSSIKTKEIISCKNRKYKIEHFFIYKEKSAKGVPVQYKNPNTQWDDLIPDSFQEDIYKKICTIYNDIAK